MKKPRSLKPVIWYQIIIEFCPVCGDETKYRERKYGYKPDNVYKREEIYDWCEGI